MGKICRGNASCGKEKGESEFYKSSRGYKDDNLCKRCRSIKNSKRAGERLREKGPIKKRGRKPHSEITSISKVASNILSSRLVGI